MIKTIYLSFFLGIASLSASSFRQEFLDSVLEIASVNPAGIMSDEKEFLQNFYEGSKQEATETDAKVRPIAKHI